MSEQIRFHLDEHIDSNIARGLRRYGIDVTTTVDAGLRTKSDDYKTACRITSSKEESNNELIFDSNKLSILLSTG